MLYIENLSLNNIVKGIHKNKGSESVLIQIVTPGDDFPKSKDKFLEVYRFEIADLVDREAFDQDEHFTVEHAKQIVKILFDAYSAERNVVVHCNAGLSRSGAVAFIGRMMGFELRYRNQLPNPNMMRLMESVIMENEDLMTHFEKARRLRFK